jgi:uncharacterized membrane protein
VIAFLDRFDREPFGSWDVVVLACMLAFALRGSRSSRGPLC